ncbi:hypothetical protein QFC20_007017 [Naganishia adeliensis]|uniref:Uncharacterized protein n=1 Tax=Naganishia adeliensis TaxID=92952 RepID=A0ACC2V5S2_9TREE|nr:hypothetical protein QFC20_007017 [Naganishia adeliensis]
MQRTIEDLVNEADYSSTDNIVLALHCGHMLTVESADGIAGLSSFYEQDKNGNWTRPVAPSESVSAPRCPSCRAPFSLNRYGRVFKKTDVDLSEQSLVGTSNSRLMDIQRRLDALKDIQLPKMEDGPKEFYTDSRYEKSKIRVNHGLVTAFEAKRTVDISLFTEKLWKTFGINNKAATLWERQTGSEIKLLREANAVIKQSSPQQNAWDASYAKLFRAEMATGKCRPEGAQVLARRSLGTPRPSGKQQYAIQATLLSIQIRHRLARIAQQFSEATKDEVGKRHWDLLASILLTSTVMDAETVKGDACEAVLRRSYYAVSHYYLLSAFLSFRHYASTKLRQTLSSEGRQNLVSDSRAAMDRALAIAQESMEDRRSAMHSSVGEGKAAEFQALFLVPAEKIMEEWKEFSERLLSTDFIQPVSEAEKLQLIKSFGFSHRGHFFTCPNGHPYVITECGGAMQQSACPECGATIGGNDHRVDRANRVDETMENLAQ